MSKTPENSVTSHITKDGSHTLFSSKFDQYYHNPNGAVSESIHVFFEQSNLITSLKQNKPIQILEVGFGTGLNLILLLNFIDQFNYTGQIRYESIEAYPIEPDEAGKLDFGSQISKPLYQPLLREIFQKISENKPIDPIHGIDVKIHNDLFKNISLDEGQFNFVFFDAFSPEANPELWTAEVFEKVFEASSEDVVLTSYCAASSARAAMAKAGFYLARTRGALGKREMTIAAKMETKLSGFKRINEQRLINRWDAGEFG